MRLEPAMDKTNTDALWARFREETAKLEKLSRNCTQEMTNLITNFVFKDLLVAFEETLKKEIASVGKTVAQTLTPIVEKAPPSTIYEEFQKGVGGKPVGLLEKEIYSKLEATVATHIQAQFQKSGKQALQEALKSTLEASVIPAFDMSCKAVFGKVDAKYQKDAVNSTSSMTQTPSGELAEGRRKLMALLMEKLIERQEQMRMMLAITDTKEGMGFEPAMGCYMDKSNKTNTDALWARFREEIAKLSHNGIHRTTDLISNCVNIVLSVIVKHIWKEIGSAGKSVAQSLTPVVKKTLSSTIYKVFQEFQKGAGDKTVGLVEIAIYSTLEDTLARQIQAQFQKYGEQALQEALKSTLEASVIPAFNMSCKAVFEQVDANFQKVMTEHVGGRIIFKIHILQE